MYSGKFYSEAASQGLLGRVSGFSLRTFFSPTFRPLLTPDLLEKKISVCSAALGIMHHFFFSLFFHPTNRKSTTPPAASTSTAKTTTPSCTSTTWTSVWIPASTPATPPTCTAAARRSPCSGCAATWPLCGPSSGFWLRSSSSSSSSSSMRSARSRRIYKTVSHRTGVFYYSAVFNMSEGLTSFFKKKQKTSPFVSVGTVRGGALPFSGVLPNHPSSRAADGVT